jgi:uncharacterized membrane protein YdbT with pleckstrin-like domain
VNALHDRVCRLLRVPPEPHPPTDPGPVRVFRASRRFYHYRLIVWALQQLGTLFGIFMAFFFMEVLPEPASRVLRFFEVLAVFSFLAQLPFTYAMLRLDFDMRWYMVTDRSIRIREGVATVKEKTMTFANVQNLTVKQGPLQRLLGIADLEVRTAGGGEGKKGQGIGESMHVGYFRGVDNAEEIRDVIRAGVRHHRDSGLGDPDEAPHLPPAPAPAGSELRAAAREMLAEARGLREVVERATAAGG